LLAVTIGIVVDRYAGSAGGYWQGAFRIASAFIVLILVSFVLLPSSERGRLRVFLTKSFLPYKYDYRKEWLRFIGTLSETGLDDVPKTSIRAVARIVNSPGGVAWARDRDGQRYVAIDAWQHARPYDVSFDVGGNLAAFLSERKWVVNLVELKQDPSLYGGLRLDPWLMEDRKWWLIVPLLLGNDLYGFIALLRPTTTSTLNFEDHDLLRTVGRHVATHLKQAESDQQLAEAQQFGAYHRLSAFMMHDLNNLAAQLALVVKNAERHRHDPRFIDDTIATIRNAVTRMNRLLEQLSNVLQSPKAQKVNIIAAVKRAIQSSKLKRPHPELTSSQEQLFVYGDPDRITSVFEHLIRNAQDATTSDGKITVAILADERTVSIRVSDTGCGMSDDFINERLFRPFDSTKGSQGMGIGAYQAREYIRGIDGHLHVASVPGEGTSFTIQLPIVREREAVASQ